MFTTKSLLRTCAAASLTLFAAGSQLTAQELTSTVVRDPAAGTATYTFDVTAPPGSRYFLLTSPFTVNPPLVLPGFFNPLELDLSLLFPISPQLSVGPTGVGTFALTVPISVGNRVEIPFQALVIDPLNQLAFSSLASCTHGAGTRDFAPPAWAGHYSRAQQRYTMTLRGNPGDQIRILVNGGQKATGFGIIPAGGQTTTSFQVDLRRGDQITIEWNGQVIHQWVWC